jgi:hypothetical protein
MRCEEYELALMDLGRGQPGSGTDRAAVLAHVQHCRRCAAVLANQQALSRGLRALADSAEVPANLALEGRLLDGLSVERARGAASWRAGALKVAAAILLVVGGLFGAWRDLTRVQRQAPPASEFVPWPGAAALPPFESGELIRTKLPAEVLPALGFQPVPSALEQVPADLLVGQDGLVRAVRLAN